MNDVVVCVGAKILYWRLVKMASEDFDKSLLTGNEEKEMRVSLQKQKPATSNSEMKKAVMPLSF